MTSPKKIAESLFSVLCRVIALHRITKTPLSQSTEAGRIILRPWNIDRMILLFFFVVSSNLLLTPSDSHSTAESKFLQHEAPTSEVLRLLFPGLHYH
ncbi:hypothetical protein Y697_09255 [Mesotoga sp. BH458_6_3_2_1]|nr:hypothetical protein Y697_09255 [Mesotoga sp. BH458_6_3_2_1]